MGKKSVEILMSVMHQDDFEIAYRTGIKSDLLIINQCDKDDYQELEVDGHLWRMYFTTERGAARSRNMALKYAKGDLCLFCDDDETLSERYVEIIQEAYEQLSMPAAVVFNINRINYSMKKTYYQIQKVRIAPTWRAYGNPMLSINRQMIMDYNIIFDEHFGAGTEWGGGEESLFEYSIKKNKLKMYEYPATIATVDYSGGSTWFHGYTEKYFYNLGAFISYRYKGKPFLKFARKLYTCFRLKREQALGITQKMKWMRLGERGIKKNVTYSEFLEQSNRN